MSPKVFIPDPSKRGKAKWGQSPEVRVFREQAPPKPPEAVSWWMQPAIVQDRAAFQLEARKRHPSSLETTMVMATHVSGRAE